MAKFAINQEGANSLKNLANGMLININEIIEAGQRLKGEVSSIEESLGIYGDEINQIIGRNTHTLATNRDDIVQLATRISSKADDVFNLVAMGLADTSGLGNNGVSNSNEGISSSGNSSLQSPNVSSMEGRYASQEEKPKVLSRDKNEATAEGMRAIDAQMEALRDDLRDKGYTDSVLIESIVAQHREAAEIEFFNDLYGTVEDKALASLSRLSDYFTESGWNQLSQEQRQDALDTLARDAGEAYRTQINGVVFFDGPPNERGYFNGDGYLYINSDCLSDPKNRLDAIDTIYHEGRHAFQHAAISNPSKYGITSEQAQRWQENFNHYLSSSKFGYERYFNQPVEADAFGFADYVIKNGGIS